MCYVRPKQRDSILNKKNHIQAAILGFALLLASNHGWSDTFFINPGLNDAWVNTDAPFQGLFITVFPDEFPDDLPDLNLIFVAWFTFDSEQPPEDVTAVVGAPDQRWITALGEYHGNLAEFKAELTTGGKFNASDPFPTQDTEYGTIDIEFTDCENGLVNYSFPAAGQAGSFSIQRFLDDNVALCEMLNTE
jgi:hypothetical protein